MTSTVLVTGATSGIGRAVALRLCRAGHHVLATGRNGSALDDLAADASGAHGDLQTLVLDVTDARAVASLEAQANSLLGGRPIDVLVNNAGYSNPGPLELVGDSDLRRQFDTNVFGLMAVTRALVAGMRSRGHGRVVNISSGMGRQTLPLHGAYNATKYAVEALSDAMRMELAPFGVQVVLVEPGTIRSGFSERALRQIRQYGDVRSPYSVALQNADRAYKRNYGSAPGPESVAETVRTAVEASRPRARYIGARTWVRIAVLETIPTAWADALKRRALGYAVEVR
jgi:NAD(P)-dependent dehydrogenase (short-subunit alcohol dehydrogenase family)